MESLLGFSELPTGNEDDSGQSHRLKLVPWISWDEWDYVRTSLFSSSPHSVGAALRRIAAWRSRGCLPVLVEVTTYIIQIQQKDPFFRSDLNGRAVDSDEMLSMWYCMAIIRLVNCVIERTRKKHKTSIAEAAVHFDIPRMLIDIRHEGSHRDLPSVQLVRDASMKALDWLITYYWDFQKQVIPNTDNVRKKIRKKLEKLFFSLKAKNTARLKKSTTKGTRAKRLEHLCGSSKFLQFVAVKNAHTKSSASLKRQVTKSLKNVLSLYFSYSAEVVDVLVEILLTSSESLLVAESLCQQEGGDDHAPSLLDEWKPVIIKLSHDKSELLLSLVTAVLEKIETEEDCSIDIDQRHFTAENMAKRPNIKLLPLLFVWLVRILSSTAAGAKDSCNDMKFQKHTVAELLQRCLVAASNGNNQLTDSALVLVHMLENKTLNSKLEKFLSLTKLDHDFDEACSLESRSQNLLSLEHDVTDQAVQSEDLLKSCRLKGKRLESRDDHVEVSCRWVVQKSWTPCPIGMLPHPFRSSGRLPVLDCKTEGTEALDLVNGKNEWESNQCSVKKTDPPCDVDPAGNPDVEEMEMEECQLEDDENVSPDEDIKGRLMIDGVRKKVTERELVAITSNIRILV